MLLIRHGRTRAEIKACEENPKTHTAAKPGISGDLANTFRRHANRQRFWELDFSRGIAVLMMVTFHFAFDLAFFSIYRVPLGSLPWLVFARATAALFIVLAGVSLTISSSRGRKHKYYLKRGLSILSLGLLITIATYLAFPQWAIWFGILHFFGVSTPLGYLALRLRSRYLLVLAALLLLSGIYLQTQSFQFPWLLWLGFQPTEFYTFDYFPLLPWFSLLLFGIVAGRKAYPSGKRAHAIREFRNPISFIGRRSLLIYFVHQPILIALILLLLK